MKKVLYLLLCGSCIGASAMERQIYEQTWLGLLPNDLRVELSYYNIKNQAEEVKMAVEAAKTYDEALYKAKELSQQECYALAFNNLSFTQNLITLLMKKYNKPFDPAVGYVDPEKAIAEALGTLGAQQWLELKSLESAYFDAIFKGNCEVVESILSQGIININAKDKLGYTALMFAVDYGHKDLILLLLQKGIDVNAESTLNWTALKRAQLYNSNDIVELLKIHGAIDNRGIEASFSKS